MPGIRGTGSFGMFGLSALKIGKYAALFKRRSTSASLYVSGFTPGGNVGGSGNGSDGGAVGPCAPDGEAPAGEPPGPALVSAVIVAAPPLVGCFVDLFLVLTGFLRNNSGDVFTPDDSKNFDRLCGEGTRLRKITRLVSGDKRRAGNSL